MWFSGSRQGGSSGGNSADLEISRFRDLQNRCFLKQYFFEILRFSRFPEPRPAGRPREKSRSKVASPNFLNHGAGWGWAKISASGRGRTRFTVPWAGFQRANAWSPGGRNAWPRWKSTGLCPRRFTVEACQAGWGGGILVRFGKSW